MRFLYSLLALLIFAANNTMAQSPQNNIMLDSFELADSKNALNGYWFTYTDDQLGGRSTIHKEYITDTLLKSKVLQLTYLLKKGTNQWDPFAALSCKVTPGMVPKDIKALTYSYKGSAHSLLFKTSEVEDFGYYQASVPSSRVWKTIIIPLWKLRQPGWAKPVPFNLHALNGWAWHITGNDLDNGNLCIDNAGLLNVLPAEVQEETRSTLQQSEDALQSEDVVKGLYAVIVQRDNKVILKKFYNGKTEKSLLPIYSVTKSLMALLIGIAVDKGFIKSADQPIADFFPTLSGDTSSAKKQITIRHLMNQTSGLPTYEWPHADEWFTAPNPSLFLLSQPLVSKPGTTYQYNTAATHLLSGIIRQATQLGTAEFADRYLFQPLAITGYQWDKLNDGNNSGGGFPVFFKAEDLVKIGQLLLNKGRWNGKVLISDAWQKQLFPESYTLPAPWGLPNSMYNLCWYKSEYKNYTIHYASGYGGQYLFLIPELKTMITVQHTTQNVNANRQSYLFLENTFPVLIELVLPEIKKKAD